MTTYVVVGATCRLLFGGTFVGSAYFTPIGVGAQAKLA